MPKLVIRSATGDQEREFEGELTVGRGPDNDVVLTEGGVSRAHARFFMKAGAVWVQDAGSSNGTLVDGVRLAEPKKLVPSSVVTVGDYEISLKVNRASRESKPAGAARSTGVLPKQSGGAKRVHSGAGRAASGASPVPVALVLKGLNGPVVGKTFALESTVTLGRVAGVDVQIEDDSVSRRHAEVTVRAGKVTVKDLGSANGTSVNGDTIEGSAPLKAGDVLRLGVVELAVEAASKGLARTSKPASLAKSDDEPGNAAPERARSASTSRKAVIAVLVLVVVGVVAAKVMMGEVTHEPGGEVGAGPADAGPVVVAVTDDMRTQCRLAAQSDATQVLLERAEKACAAILEIEPIDSEAMTLRRVLKRERECNTKLEAASGQMTAQRFDDVVKTLSDFSTECYGLLRAKDLAQESAKSVMRQAGKDCDRFSKAGEMAYARDACELYMRLSCQNQPEDALYVPATKKIVLYGRLGSNGWRPKDARHLNLLQSLDALNLSPASWRCDPIPVLRVGKSRDDEQSGWLRQLESVYPDEDIRKAAKLYFEGEVNRAENSLLKLAEKRDKGDIVRQVRDLARDIRSATQLDRQAKDFAARDMLDRAVPLWDQALEFDARIVLGAAAVSSPPDGGIKALVDSMPSKPRLAIYQELTSTAFRVGRMNQSREDPKRACRAYQMGQRYWTGNTDLQRGAQRCTEFARDALANAAANDCEALKVVLDAAIDGDGLAELAQAKKVEWNCP